MEADPRGAEPLACSLESRDNPFLPGGELSREAEDLLSRATIIRDHFYLNEDGKQTPFDNHNQQPQQRSGKHVHIVDQPDDVRGSGRPGHSTSSSPSQVVFEDNIAPQATALSATAPASSLNGSDSHQRHPRENGKFKDLTSSSGSDKRVIPDGESQPSASSHAGTVSGAAPTSGTAGDLQIHDLEKKKRNKCCSVM